jgi:hypothetical protein
MGKEIPLYRESTMRSSLLSRSGLILGLATLCFAASTGAAPFTRGVTYRVRMSSRLPPQMAGMGGDGGAGPLILARASAVGNRARFDLLTLQPAPPGTSADDYLLVLDSSRTLLVNPAERSYSDATALFSGGGLGMLGAMGGGRRGGRSGGGAGTGGGGMPQVDISGLVTDFEHVGPDTVDGRQTQHYRIVAEMSVAVMGNQTPLRIIIDTWTANLPYRIVNPFDGPATVPPDDPAAKLTAKLNELRKKIEGTPIKSVVTTSLTLGGPAGAGMALDFVQTTAITDIKEMDVDEKSLEVPAGFTKKAGS